MFMHLMIRFSSLDMMQCWIFPVSNDAILTQWANNILNNAVWYVVHVNEWIGDKPKPKYSTMNDLKLRHGKQSEIK